jgi:hypothetical protein
VKRFLAVLLVGFVLTYTGCAEFKHVGMGLELQPPKYPGKP